MYSLFLIIKSKNFLYVLVPATNSGLHLSQYSTYTQEKNLKL